jgi:glycosyltransferase involved in cell wall biosynthesis
MGKPIVTTSLAGCRAVVQDGLNGYLCEPRDAGSLIAALRRMIAAGPGGRAEMGARGRERMEAAFSVDHIRRAYLETARGLLR